MAKKLYQRISLLQEKKREIPSGQDRPILPAQVANQNTGFASILSARGASHIIISDIN